MNFFAMINETKLKLNVFSTVDLWNFLIQTASSYQWRQSKNELKNASNKSELKNFKLICNVKFSKNLMLQNWIFFLFSEFLRKFVRNSEDKKKD